MQRGGGGSASDRRSLPACVTIFISVSIFKATTVQIFTENRLLSFFPVHVQSNVIWSDTLGI